MDLFARQSGLRRRKNRLCGDAANAAKNGFDGPVIFGVREENLASALCFRAVVPALEKSKMALANCGRGRGRGPRPRSGSFLCQRIESRLEPGFENAARDFRYVRYMR